MKYYFLVVILILSNFIMKKEINKSLNIIKSEEVNEGAGVLVNRVIGIRSLRNLDPFLMLDYLNSDVTNGFPDHPHRGFETVSYIIDGSIIHEDFKGHKGIISNGDVQWMTAGKGIVHSEMPENAEDSKKMKGFQLWVNLPKKEKLCEPAYQEYSSKNIPIYEEEGKWVKIIAGKYMDKIGSCKSKGGNISYFDVRLEYGKSIEINDLYKKNGLVFVYDGEMMVNDQTVKSKFSAVFTEKSLLETLILKGSSKERSGAIIFFGEPIKEPIVQYGPFVMTTNEEIQTAFEDFQYAQNGFEGANTWLSSRGNKKKKKDL